MNFDFMGVVQVKDTKIGTSGSKWSLIGQNQQIKIEIACGIDKSVNKNEL